MIKIMIADSQAVIREGIKLISSGEKDIKIIGELEDVNQILPQITKVKTDIIVMELTLPGHISFEIINKIKDEFPSVKILILSIYPEERYAVRAINAGADGYITKDCCPEDLLLAIRKVCSGKIFIKPYFRYLLFDALKANYLGASPHKLLSDREYQVMCLLASGYTVKEISQNLSLSISTISTYRSRILLKMNMTNNAELTLYAISRKLIN